MNVTLSSMSCRSEFQTEQVLVAGEVDGALNRLGGHVAGDGEVHRHAREAARLVFGALGDEARLQPLEIMSALLEDVDHIHRHAPGDREPEGLHRRWPGDRRAVERHARLT